MLRHTEYHIQYIEGIEYDLEILVCQQLKEEVDQLLRLNQYVLRVSFNTIFDVMKHLIDSLGPHSPIVLGVHHPLDLVRGNELALFRWSIFLAWFDCISIIVVYILWKANIAHRCEHLLLRWSHVLRLIVQYAVHLGWYSSFQSRVIVVIIVALLFLYAQCSKVSCRIHIFQLLVLLFDLHDFQHLLLIYTLISWRRFSIFFVLSQSSQLPIQLLRFFKME